MATDMYHGEVTVHPYGPARADVVVEVVPTEAGPGVEITVTRWDEFGETAHALVLSMAEAREVCHGLVSCLR